MAGAALITWLITATGGFVLLARWVAKGGHHPDSGSRLAPGLVFGHFALAVIGLLVWIGYLVWDNRTLAWTAFGLLLPVALLGFAMFARWLPARHGDRAEAHFPVAVVAGHGLFAVATLVLVLLVAVEVS
ncbi:hypothetical protein [Actinoplanes aureus]|jgi:hypothetical protein|uniref:Uncharacterized protein n=1 Tax=Actinoplanes aureus TaxID=2792083 RepID=A0A931FYW3_9ACTN|nr:hypothetical protein [Actinoplanes aureus]MBG0564060.1 hypothetical protein [Actinoplanes aureus]